MNLTDPAILRSLLRRHGVQADKQLGQHFLIDQGVVNTIVEAAAQHSGVLEIGPGPGVLTSPLSEMVASMTAIEFDARMVNVLRESAPRCEVVQADVLQLDLAPLLATLPTPRAIISNLPYYITGPILDKIVDATSAFSSAVLMMQREVAQRVIAPARHSARGALSVAMEACFSIELLAQVPSTSFFPPPKVASTVLQLIPSTKFEQEDFKAFSGFVHACFRHPRKTLVNNLGSSFGLDKQAGLKLVQSAGLIATSRPQELDLQSWTRLYQAAGSLAPVIQQ